jgi:hypothetical protein
MDLPTFSLVSTIICDDFEESKINYIDELPLELHGKIVKNIFDLVVHKDEGCKKYIDQEKLKKYIQNIPLFLGIKVAHEFSQFQEICQYKIGFKKFNARQLFVLPCQQRDLFMRIANRSVFEEGDMYVDDKKIIDNMPSDIKKGLCLTINRASPALIYTKNASVLGIFLGISSLLAMLNIPTKYEKKYKWLFSRGFLGSYVTSCLCFITYLVCELSLGPRYGRNGYLKEVKF